MIAVEARCLAGPMTELMESGSVPIDRLEIGSRRRHLHEIARRVVVGAVRHELGRYVQTSRFSATGAGSLSSDLQPVTADPARTLALYGGGAAFTSGSGNSRPCAGLCVRDGSPKGEDLRSGASALPTARSRRETP